MGFFGKHLNKQKTTENIITTEGFFIGSSEAEGEINNSRITLDEVFSDYLGVLNEVNHEKFIITGRKGTGKSAIGAYINYISEGDANLFCSFIRKNDIDIEQIIQNCKEQSLVIQNQLLFKWIILTKILSLISQNQNIQSLREYEHLKKFLERNRGFIDIKNNEIVEVIKETGAKVEIEYFKRLFRAALNQDIRIKESKADFYKLIPSLQDVILKLIEKDSDNKYVIIFDDLDINFSINSKENINTLIELIRIAKEYNNEIFGKSGAVKIILLLRDDIVKSLLQSADLAKILASYEVSIKWYEDIYRNSEDNTKLKQFINSRIKRNLELNNIPIINGNPWATLINEKEIESYNKTSFKYIIDHTFYRPRDLILLFKDLSSMKLKIPLSKNDIHNLIGKYSHEIIKELYNELSILYKKDEIENIFEAIEVLSNGYRPSFTYQELIDELNKHKLKEPHSIIETIFEYSLIGNIDDDENVTFKYREKGLLNYKINKKLSLIPHYILKVYFKQS